MTTPARSARPPVVHIVLAGHPPSPNRVRGSHWSTRWKHGATWRDAAAWAATQQRPPAPWAHAHVVITFVHVGRRLYDVDNATAACKPVVDGLRVAGVILDDSPTHITLQIEQTTGSAREVRITVEPIAAPTPTDPRQTIAYRAQGDLLTMWALTLEALLAEHLRASAQTQTTAMVAQLAAQLPLSPADVAAAERANVELLLHPIRQVIDNTRKTATHMHALATSAETDHGHGS